MHGQTLSPLDVLFEQREHDPHDDKVNRQIEEEAINHDRGKEMRNCER